MKGPLLGSRTTEAENGNFEQKPAEEAKPWKRTCGAMREKGDYARPDGTLFRDVGVGGYFMSSIWRARLMERLSWR